MIRKSTLPLAMVAALVLVGCNGRQDADAVQQDGVGAVPPSEIAPGAADPGLAPGGPGATGTPGSMAPDGTMPQDTLGQGGAGTPRAPSDPGRP